MPGYFSDGKPLSFQMSLIEATNLLTHRGPDAAGQFIDEHCGLGHRRLSIIDLSEAANQPMYSACGKYVIVFNGEIYNYREIAQELNISMRTSSDSEVLLEGFVKIGHRILDYLNGMFTFAIYNKDHNELTIARDKVGIKPLYYFWDGSRFAFASEMKALIAFVGEKQISMQALKDYLFLEYIPAPLTIFENYKKLESGHMIEISAAHPQPKISTHYNLLDKLNDSAPKEEKVVLNELDELMRSSLAYRSISDVPIGAFLSGGTDSSLVCAYFQEINDSPVHTFNVSFDVSTYDESGYAGRVAKELKTDHEKIDLQEADSLKIVRKIHNCYDLPFAVSSILPSYQVCQHAREKVTVALSGDGGDELFMGYGHYFWMDRINQNQIFRNSLSRKMAVKVMNQLPDRFKRAARVIDFDRSDDIWLHVWSQEQYMFTQKEVGELLNSTYDQCSLSSKWATINKLDVSDRLKVSLFDLTNYLADDLLYKMDIASMANSLEVRVPLLDHRIVEYAINLDEKFKIQGKEQKVVAKKMLEKFLPDDLIYRTKWGFPAPVSKWLYGELGYLITKYLNAKVINKQGIFNMNFIEKLILNFKKGRAFHNKRIWALITFQMWFDEYVEKLTSELN